MARLGTFTQPGGPQKIYSETGADFGQNVQIKMRQKWAPQTKMAIKCKSFSANSTFSNFSKNFSKSPETHARVSGSMIWTGSQSRDTQELYSIELWKRTEIRVPQDPLGTLLFWAF